MIRRMNVGNRIHFIPGIGVQVITPRAAAAREARIAAFRTKAKTGRITLADLRAVVQKILDKLIWLEKLHRM